MPSDWETLGRIVLSVVLSGLIGIEREFRQRARDCGPIFWSDWVQR